MDQETKQEFKNLAVMVQEGFVDFEKKIDRKFVDFEEKVDNKLGKLKLDFLDAMDDKLADLKGDLVVLMRKEDRKVVSLIELLTTKKILSGEEAKALLSLEPFPQLMA